MKKNANLLADELLTARTRAMAEVLAEEGVTHASYVRRVMAIADAAAEQADFSGSMKGYELIGKALGYFAAEQHLHLHGGAGGPDFAQLSDAQLRAMCKEAQVIKPEQAPPPAPTLEAPQEPVFDTTLWPEAVHEALS